MTTKVFSIVDSANSGMASAILARAKAIKAPDMSVQLLPRFSCAEDAGLTEIFAAYLARIDDIIRKASDVEKLCVITEGGLPDYLVDLPRNVIKDLLRTYTNRLDWFYHTVVVIDAPEIKKEDPLVRIYMESTLVRRTYRVPYLRDESAVMRGVIDTLNAAAGAEILSI